MTPYVADTDFTLWNGDCLQVLAGMAPGSIDAVVTSPPYMDTRPDYEPFTAYPDLFREMGRVVTGPVLVNVGRIFRGRREQLWWVEIVRAAERMGWGHADTLVWIKPNSNAIHGNVFVDRHEYVLAFSRPGDLFNDDAVRVPYAESSVPRMKRGWINHTGVKGDAKRAKGRRSSEPHPLGGRAPSYVTVHTGGEKGNEHPAPMPEQLAKHLVKLATFTGGTVLDPFFGSGTTGLAARKLGRSCVGIEKREDYCEMAARRLGQLSLLAEHVNGTEHAQPRGGSK